ncbi:MAG: response regulator [Chitinophagaceae bacterium]
MHEKILLVDDREDNLFSMETILEPGGYQLIKVNSGRQALKILLSEFDFALILMDVKMPNLNGFETAALIYEREKLRHIPIIFITANTYGDENIFKGYKTGAVDYIYKPVNPELLRAKVGVFVDLYKMNRQLLLQEQKLKDINRNLENEISERKASEATITELNQQLLKNIERLQTANKELDRFAFMASHDLQEPLRKIITFSDLLTMKYKDNLEDNAIMYLSRIQNAAGRMKELIKDILAFSQINSNNDAFVLTDIKEIITEVIEDLETTVSDAKARIQVVDMPSLYVNPRLMKPLFSNLIINALKYCKKGTAPLVKIYTNGNDSGNISTANEPENKYCRIYVEDNGIGFEQKYAEEIFEMFKRLHGHSEYAGTGIGLALCKQIVTRHNGFISALGKENEGATFIVSLPLAHKSN